MSRRPHRWATGYAFAYGDVDGGFIGKKYFFGMGMEGLYGSWFFQYAFACTAATIVSGSLAERVNINNYLIFSLLMTGFIYPVVVARTWGGGWLSEIGFCDFAGSGVVHLTGGIAGVAGAAICGPRMGKFDSLAKIQHTNSDNEVAPSRRISVIYGYQAVLEKFHREEWDITRVHEFVKMYNHKLANK